MKKKYGKIVTMCGNTIYPLAHTREIDIFAQIASCGETAICTGNKNIL
jgi:hypothetical protein